MVNELTLSASNEPPEWNEWDNLFERAANVVVKELAPAFLKVDEACFKIVLLALPLYRAWGNVVTAEHIDRRLQRELERANGDKPKALIRALTNKLPSAYMRRHANDYATDMRGTMLFLNYEIETASWEPDMLPVQESEVQARIYALAGTEDPGQCIGKVRDLWDRAKKAAPKPPPQPDDEDDDDLDDIPSPATVLTADTELRRIRNMLRNMARRSEPLTSLDPPDDKPFYMDFGFDGGPRYSFDDVTAMFLARALLKR